MPEVGSGMWAKWMKVVKRYKLLVLISSGDVMYNMMTIVNNTVSSIWKLLRKEILKLLISSTT